MPALLITTPESLHVLLAQKGYAKMFAGLKAVVVDEWHELLGSKRGVQVELARLRETLIRINNQRVIIRRPEKPTPFAFPIMVDRLREKLSSEKLEDRIKRMTIQFEK